MIRMSFSGGIYILLLLMMFLFRKYVSDFSSSKWVFFPSTLISESDHWTWTNQPEYSCAPYLVFPTRLSLSFHSLFGCINPCLVLICFTRFSPSSSLSFLVSCHVSFSRIPLSVSLLLHSLLVTLPSPPMNVSARWRNHRRSHQAAKKNKRQRQNDTISQQFVSLVSASTANDCRTKENHEQSSSFHLPLNLFSHVNVFAFLAFFLFLPSTSFHESMSEGERQGISYCTLLGYFGPDDVWISMCLAMRLNVTQELQERHYSSGLDPSTNKTGNTFPPS